MTDTVFTNEQLDFVYEMGNYAFTNYLFGTVDGVEARRNDFINSARDSLQKNFNEDFINEAQSMSYTDFRERNLRNKIVEFIFRLEKQAYSDQIVELWEFNEFSESFFDDFWKLLDAEGYDYDGSEIDEKYGY